MSPWNHNALEEPSIENQYIRHPIRQPHREEARQAGAELLRSSDFHYAVTPNPEFILTADKDLEFQKILNQADLVLPDGIGVVYSAKILGTPLKERGG